jgi:hypothetical protein
MRFGLVVSAILVVGGCSFDTGGPPAGGANDATPTIDVAQAIDGTSDDSTPAIDARFCDSWQPAHFDACAIPAPTGPADLMESGTYTYNTDNDMLTPPGGSPAAWGGVEVMQSDGPIMRLLSVDSFHLRNGSNLDVVGALPFVVASFSNIDIEGTLDVSSPKSGALGAGANPSECSDENGEVGDGIFYGGGGGGGGYGASGGDGGTADGGNVAGGAKGNSISPPTTVRGGCVGGRGGVSGGLGGRGGGAVQLSARLVITVAASGRIDAGGSGGRAGGIGDVGGGGGGSGGLIGLDGLTVVTVSGAIVAANGGGGGGGADGAAGTDGGDGQLGAVAADGGGGAGNAGDGGRGGFRDTPTGAAGGGGNGFDGGAGGGGGNGYIIIDSADVTNNATVSPTPIVRSN